MKNLIVLVIVFAFQFGSAQTQDAWVYFTDKEDVQISIDNPLTILTQKAIDRKALHEVPIDERDVPVTESYITEIKNASGITYWAKSKWMNCAYVQGTMEDIEALLALPFVSNIEWADKDLNFPNPVVVPDKFTTENQNSRIEYNYGAAANQVEMINADYLHEQDFTGEGMTIAVMDSGFPNFETNPAFSHIISNNKLLGTFDFFSRTTDVTGTGQHGVNTTSDMAAFLQDEFVGTAPNASYYLFRTEYGPSENPREEAWWVEALERADSLGVDVTNTSLGYREYDNSNYTHTYEDLDGVTTFAALGANIATEKGMIVVTSAGNSGNGFGTVATPADALDILAVGAVNSSGNYASFSSRGPTVDGRIKPDVMAQGQGSAIIRENGTVDFSNGTSFSSPILAGAVACLWESRPEVRNFNLMRVVRETASMYANPTDQMGYGIANFEEAYNALQVLGQEQFFLTENFAVYPNPVRDVLNISFPKTINKAVITFYNILGNEVMKREITSSGNQVTISNLPQGIYIATVVSDQAKNSFKIIKQ